jgi:hypothetical protein
MGAKIVKLTFHYVLDAWQTRNDIEHGMDNNPIRTKKEKLIRKIMWQKAKVNFISNIYLQNLTEEQLHILPMENLEMTDAQLRVLIKGIPQ